MTIDDMFEKVCLEGSDKIQQKLERHISSREVFLKDRIYLYADARETLMMQRKKKKVVTTSLKRKASQRFRVQLKELDFHLTVDSIYNLLREGRGYK